MASQMEAIGLEPAGDGGGFVQRVPLRVALKDPARSSLVVSGGGQPDEALVLEQDFEDFVPGTTTSTAWTCAGRSRWCSPRRRCPAQL